MHLSFIIPYFLVLWTRRHWHIWLMAVSFIVLTYLKVWWILPPEILSPRVETVFYFTAITNILVGGLIMSFVLILLKKLVQQSESLLQQKAELEDAASKLSQQNEEIQAQAEELIQQNEEMEAQAEELSAQNEELHEANGQLGRREEVLRNLLQFSSSPDDASASFQDLCQNTLIIIGPPAGAVAIIEENDNETSMVDHARASNAPSLPVQWAFENNLLDLVWSRRKTAYVSDLNERPDLADPFRGESGYRSLIATPIHLASGRKCALLAASTDVSHWSEEQFKVLEWLAAQCGLFMDTLRLQTTLKNRAAELETANRSKDQFFAMLSHELRTPMTPVLAAVGVLGSDGRLPQDVRDDLEMIRRNVRIQSRLIDDLLDLTRISQGKIELEWQPLQVAGLLKHTAQIVAPDLDAKNQKLELVLDNLENCTVHADGPRLQQVFWNLLKNAVKFSPPKSVIQLHAASGKDEVTISVRDRGQGLARENLDRIFLPFEQVRENHGTGTGGGLGLGLAIAKAVVEMHGGRIAASSDGMGKGCCFDVTLPLLQPEVHPEAGETAAAPAASSGSDGIENILVVEDHADTGLILTRILQSMGYKPSYASTAAEACELFGRIDFDLVISDLGLPDESGLDLMRKLKKLRPQIRGICLSGYGMEEDRQACKEVGFMEHLTKPVEITSLEMAIQKISRQGQDGKDPNAGHRFEQTL